MIPVGALIVGISNSLAADYMLETLVLNPLQLKKDGTIIQGVLFFDTSLSVNEWIIRDVEGREWPRYSSPVDERNCLVFFDESRCRGSDVKMPQDAVFLLTVGPQMCKDKLMQAAGRARLLGKGQTLCLLGMNDVTVKIRKACGYQNQDCRDVTTLQALQWVMKNTIAATEDGMKEWGLQGGLFCITEGKGEEEFALLNEQISLEDLYNHPFNSQVMNNVHKNSCKMLMTHRKGKKLSGEKLLLMTQIDSRIECYGSDFEISKTFIDGECERELEIEREKELEEEKQYLCVTARLEEDWNYSIILENTKVSSALRAIGIKCLTDVVQDYIGSKLKDIPWNLMGNIQCTRNFIETIVMNNTAQNIQEYLRPVDVLLYFPTQDNLLLMLSEREADSILSLMWTKEGKAASERTGVRLIHLSYMRKDIPDDARINFSWAICNHELRFSEWRKVALIQLFNGDTTYNKHQKKNLEIVLKEIAAKKAALLIPNMRGLQFNLPRSDLDIACGY